MTNYKRRGYEPPCVQNKGYSARFDSRDVVHSVALWRFPQILNAIVGNIVLLFFIALALGSCGKLI